MLTGEEKKNYQREYMREYMRSKRLRPVVKTQETPLYNPSAHKIGDRVLVKKGKRMVETIIPEIDADGQPYYE